ncbi:ribosome-associated translation inhibitor RaiA [Patescibacteria group bacterium]|nr:ribosome-associated translation inhibitor RaiA [Patescibacteria group bacterium]MBU4600708.1 ribosome-associated translation inhibitor RaiA [Patescibacteria group bacterium]MCG2698481.1 ribosome-associated translation inhibitor RaiA [Candidatus Parcubacteria bacterium]
MNINIKATNIELTPKIKDYVQEKMDMLEKYLGSVDVINAKFEVELTTLHHNKGEIYRAEANLDVPGSLLRVEKTEKDLFKAIDKVKDHLTRSIKRYKEKRIDKKRKAV